MPIALFEPAGPMSWRLLNVQRRLVFRAVPVDRCRESRSEDEDDEMSEWEKGGGKRVRFRWISNAFDASPLALSL